MSISPNHPPGGGYCFCNVFDCVHQFRRKSWAQLDPAAKAARQIKRLMFGQPYMDPFR